MPLDTAAVQQDILRNALVKLCGKYYLSTDQRDHYDNTADEDIAPFLHDGEEIGEFVAVTTHGDYFYLYPGPTLEWAQEKAVENVQDDIFEETPIAIHNLVTGQQWDARIKVKWEARD